MARFEVIESKQWVRDDGRTASIYGAVPWVSPSEEKRWKMVSRGYTVRDNERGTVGIGRQPWATRAEAKDWVDKETTRLEEARRWREQNYPQKAPAPRGRRSHATKKRSAQLDQEIREALSRIPKKPSLKTREQLDAEIDAILAGGLPAERYEVAQALGFRYPKRAPAKKMTITGTNIFALAEQVLNAGGKSTFSNRLPATDLPHIKRTLAAGLVEVSSPTTLTLTPEGRAAVLRELRDSYAHSSAGYQRSPDRYDARSKQRMEQMRHAIDNLEAGQ